MTSPADEADAKFLRKFGADEDRDREMIGARGGVSFGLAYDYDPDNPNPHELVLGSDRFATFEEAYDAAVEISQDQEHSDYDFSCQVIEIRS